MLHAKAQPTLPTGVSDDVQSACGTTTDSVLLQIVKDIGKQGLAAFNPNPAGYKVWRNVKDYGAKGVESLPYNLLVAYFDDDEQVTE